MTKVLCVGAAVVDFVFYLPQLPSRPEKYGTEDARIVGGGCAANAAVAVARLGGHAMLAARMGDDRVGEMVLADLHAEAVDVSNVIPTKGGQSSYSSVVVDAAGERQIVNFRGRDLQFDTGWFDDIEGLGAVLTDTRRVGAAVAAMELAKARGIPGIVDGEAPVDPAILYPASHIALSMQGLRSLYPDTHPQTALGLVAKTYGGWACVTDGASGVLFTDTDTGSINHHPAHAIEAVDTLAAGDIWHGAFALCLAQGAGEPEAVRFASAAAALKCTRHGGRAGCPNRQETLEFLKGEPDP